MKKIEDIQLPEELHYSVDHEWVGPEGETSWASGSQRLCPGSARGHRLCRVAAGRSTACQGEQFGTVESVKAVSELYMPVGGEILSVNKALEASPEILNREPYASGWMIEIKPSDPAELKGLMNREAYVGHLKGLSQ